MVADRRVKMLTILNQEILNRFLNQKIQNSAGESLKKVALEYFGTAPVQKRS